MNESFTNSKCTKIINKGREQMLNISFHNIKLADRHKSPAEIQNLN